MKVTVISCQSPCNESERSAISRLKDELQKLPGTDEWVLLTNVLYSQRNHSSPDEIDIIAIGPPGIRLIEVKHWSDGIEQRYPGLLEKEADKLEGKARRISSVRRYHEDYHVDGVILLTEENAKIKNLLAKKEVHRIGLYSLSRSKEALGVDRKAVFDSQDVWRLAKMFEPRVDVKRNGTLPNRSLDDFINLELQSPQADGFHRIYKGRQRTRQDRVILHLYDLSATAEKNALDIAERNERTLQCLTQYPWAPRLYTSFHPLENYPGEMYYFTIKDPSIPTLAKKKEDTDWNVKSRTFFAREALTALRELHTVRSESFSEKVFVHRNLNPQTILVKHDDTPLFMGFDFARIPCDGTVASSPLFENADMEYVAPEIRERGLGAADCRSDVYSICHTLKDLFHEGDEQELSILCVLEGGMREKPADRESLDELIEKFAVLASETPRDIRPHFVNPEAKLWSEEQVVTGPDDRQFRIVSKLGQGSVGTAFKVVEIDPDTDEDSEYFVAKTVHDPGVGKSVIKAYKKIQPILGGQPGLSTIYNFEKEWAGNKIIALMQWIDGEPLFDLAGIFHLKLEESGDGVNVEDSVLRHFREMCQALWALHERGYVHGDVSPKNILLSQDNLKGNRLILTDFDSVGKAGAPSEWQGTPMVSSPERDRKEPLTPGDDLYALAASFFYVLFERSPFVDADMKCDKTQGCRWNEVGTGRDEYPRLASIIDRTLHPDREKRYPSVLDILDELGSFFGSGSTGPGVPAPRPIELSEQKVDWLDGLLQSYPGSHRGNSETRGLDTEFAYATYVPTPLEDSLLDEIRNRQVKLVVLCGNAGDGKTALLQHLYKNLNPDEDRQCLSSHRVISDVLPGGSKIYINLDGSASWNERSADELLDEFFSPFEQGESKDDLIYLLAVNDGRLLEWIKHRIQTSGESVLTKELERLLRGETPTSFGKWIRFINLNQRSLVGNIRRDRNSPDTAFLDRLLDSLYGGPDAGLQWKPCTKCSRHDRCSVFSAGRLFGPESFPDALPEPRRRRARERLFETFQAVHLRGETHITMRELRASLVYILFGLQNCDEIHQNDESPRDCYWDRTFCFESPSRHGEVLRELARFDPALESNPQVDRFLLGTPSGNKDMPPLYPQLSLDSARRRSFFEWMPEDARQVAEDEFAVGLARGRYLSVFRGLPFLDKNSDELSEIVRKICRGISRMENLPELALSASPRHVPLRLSQKNSPETAFWVEKSLDRFHVAPVLPSETRGIDYLHRQVELVYRYQEKQHQNGRQTETLLLGYELFQYLMELAEGYQLGGVSADETFTNLSIFVQRLTRENEQTMMAWNPMQEEEIYRIALERHPVEGVVKQRIMMTPTLLENGGTP